MKAHIFERACPLYQEGAITPIFEGDMTPLKKTPNHGRYMTAIAGVLLMQRVSQPAVYDDELLNIGIS
ncbi:MAG: hypothetical protein ACI90V_004311 [Bacillariaceae sp.]|jgi:hypothetical protein